MTERPMSKRALLDYLEDARQCEENSFREADGVIRDPESLRRLRAIDTLRRIVTAVRRPERLLAVNERANR